MSVFVMMTSRSNYPKETRRPWQDHGDTCQFIDEIARAKAKEWKKIACNISLQLSNYWSISNNFYNNLFLIGTLHFGRVHFCRFVLFSN